MPRSSRWAVRGSLGSCCDAILTTMRPSPAAFSSLAPDGTHSSSRPAPASNRVGDCAFVEDRARPSDRAQIVWSDDVDPEVLTVVARSVSSHDSGFNLTKFANHAAIVATGDREHVAIRRGGGILRLDVVDGTLRDGPVRLFHRLARQSELESKMPRLRQLAAFLEFGAVAPWIIPTDPRLDRLILALRVLDARAAGASLRQIAIGLLCVRTGSVDWPGDGDSTKSRVRRLVALSEALSLAGPRGVLAHSI
jgi:hypothetical protein